MYDLYDFSKFRLEDVKWENLKYKPLSKLACRLMKMHDIQSGKISGCSR